jgi:four helix bundle protein
VSQILLLYESGSAGFGLNPFGKQIAASGGMKEPSEKRKRTLALHDRAIRFSVNVNSCCPAQFTTLPSRVVWDHLVRAADSTSNNLIEADDASSDADFLSKMGIALREVKESRAALIKLRLGNLDHYRLTADRDLESEAGQLAAIFAAIILNMRIRLDEERRTGKKHQKL